MTEPPCTTDQRPDVEQLQAEHCGLLGINLLLTESTADLVLALEDKGWQDIASTVSQGFTLRPGGH